MRIAVMLETDGPGGAEVVVFQLAEELRRRGHIVVPVGPELGVGWLRGKFLAAGFTPETFRLRRPLDVACLWNLRAMLVRERIDVVHSHEFTMSVYGAAAARSAGVPHIITMHGNQTMTAAWRRRVALRLAFHSSHATIAVSEATRIQLLRDLSLPSSAIAVVHNGIPIRAGNAAAVRRELLLRPEEVLVLAVGNLDQRKGHILLLRALAQLEAEGLAVRWRLAIAAGRGGPERESLERYAAEHGIGDRVHLLFERHDVPDLQAAAGIFCMPSLWEGLPLALLEAMFANSAIVASRTSGIPEAIVHERDGLLVPPGDVGGLAAALRRLLENSAERTAFAQSARRRAEAEFTIGRMADAYERLYQGESPLELADAELRARNVPAAFART
jgi:glycosyltransferase involved in cell wall biosynthesis